MTIISDSIGLVWENAFRKIFPELIDTRSDDNVPDFYHRQKRFWVEAKNGYVGWGNRIHEHQVENFAKLDEPVVYALAMHDLDRSMEKVNQKTERGRQEYLKKNNYYK